jgi:hypothetical protein
MVSLKEIDGLLQIVMFTLYGNQYEDREEHLLLSMFEVQCVMVCVCVSFMQGINKCWYFRRRGGVGGVKTTLFSLILK